MATRTINILLDLQATPASAAKLKAEFDALEKKAVNLQKAIDRVGTGKNADKLKASLAGVKSEMQKIDAEAGKRVLETNLKRAGDQANRTREKMEKLQQVGNRIALVGGAIIAPFALAMGKYLEQQKAIEASGGKMEASAVAMIELQKEWATAQGEIGKVATEILLPYLRDALDLVKQIAAFAKEHPGAVKAALGIGASLVVLGGMLSTAASIVSTIATVQGLAAGAGLLGGGGAAAGGVAAAGGGATAIIGAITPAIVAAVPAIVLGFSALLGGNLGLWIGNALAGTNQTWADIGNTVKMIFIMAGWGWKLLFQNIGSGISKLLNGVGQSARAVGEYFMKGITYLWTGISAYISNLIKSISTGFTDLGTAFSNGIKGLLGLPKKAAGGMTDGLSIAGDAGREFVMSNQTTRAAEGIIGGGLSQQRLLDALQGGGGRKISYYDSRKIDASISKVQRDQIMNMTIAALSGAL